MCFEDEDTPLLAIIWKILHCLKLHIRNGWEPLHFKIKKGHMTVAEACTAFCRDFGTNPRFFTFEGTFTSHRMPDISDTADVTYCVA
jgi:hypothetical protein